MFVRKVRNSLNHEVWYKSNWLEYISAKYGILIIAIEIAICTAVLFLILRG